MRRPAAHVSRRFVSLMLATAMLLTSAVTPASAEVSTLWVDDDGTVGASDCSGGQEAFTSIQLAIELAGRGDTIKVCPGTYAELLTIEGRRKRRLNLVSVGRHDAVLVEPTYRNQFSLLTIRAENVTVDGFRIRLSMGESRCRVDQGVNAYVRGAVTLKNLRIDGDVTPDASGDRCRFSGIWASGGGRVTVADSVLTGVTTGISITGIPVITGNRIESVAAAEDPDDCVGWGITYESISLDERGVIRDNTIVQVDAPPGTADTSVRVCNGITGTGWAVVSGALIDGTRTGMTMGRRTLVERSTIRDVHFLGISFRGRGEVRYVTVLDSPYGINASGARARIHDNDFLGAMTMACEDNTSPDRPGWPSNFGTANRWWNNRGSSAYPVGICTPAAS